MALQDRATLKTFYETFDKPTQGQFADWLDSVPNIVDDYKSTPVYTIAHKQVLSVAQVDNLFATPITILPAPGPNLIAWPLHGMAELKFVTSGWSGGTTIALQHVGATGAIMQCPFVLGGTQLIRRNFTLLTPFLPSINLFMPNAALQAIANADPVGGDSPAQINLVYAVYNIS